MNKKTKEFVEFKYYPNNLSLFELCEKFFPASIEIEIIDQELAIALVPAKYLKEKLAEIRSLYESHEQVVTQLCKENKTEEIDLDTNFRWQAYTNKFLELDYDGECLRSEMFLGFADVIDKSTRFDRIGLQMMRDQSLAMLQPNLYQKKTKEYYVETVFLQTVSEGVNDATCEIYILSLLEKLKNQSVRINDRKESKKEKDSAKDEISPYTTFESIFKNPAYAKLCITALRQADPQVINVDNEFLLGDEKGAFAVLYSILKTRAALNTYETKHLVPLFNQKFKGLNLYKDGKSLKEPGKRAIDKYQSAFINMLPPLKK